MSGYKNSISDIDGNVGIGTINPTSNLEVNGDIRVRNYGRLYLWKDNSSNYINYNNWITSTGATQSIQNTGSGGISLKTGSSTRLFVDNGGNVGIGTTNPNAKLHVSTSSTTKFFGTNSDYVFGSAGSGISMSTGASTGNTYFQIYAFQAGNTQYANLVIPGGNVGIGTTSPNQKLTIKGTDQYVAAEQTNYVWGGSTTIGVRMGTDATAGTLDFRRWTGTATTHGAALITQVNSDGGYGLDFRVDNKSTNTSATTSRMFLSTSGEVGIGTISPADKLHVEGNLYFGTSTRTIYTGGSGNLHLQTNTGEILFLRSNGSSESMRIDSSGNVGIGTTIPGAKLDVRVNGIGNSAGDESNSIIFQGDRHDWIFKQIRTAAATDWNSTTLRLQTRVDSTNMSSIDFVTDASYNRHIDINTNSNGFNTRFTHDGNVGIGTANPSYKLDVSGTGRFTGDVIVPAETYGAGWNGSNEVPTKNDIYDKIEGIAVLERAQVSLTSAQILALNTTPIEVVPAKGSGKIIKFYSATLKYTHITTAYSTATDIRIKYSGGTAVNYVFSDTGILGIAANQIKGGNNAVNAEILDNTALVVTTNSANPTLGDGTLVVYVTYFTETL